MNKNNTSLLFNRSNKIALTMILPSFYGSIIGLCHKKHIKMEEPVTLEVVPEGTEGNVKAHDTLVNL
jgi:hypothetical protein